MRAMVHAESTASTHEAPLYLSFFVGGKMYAVAIAAVREVVAYCRLSALPAMPEPLRGVVSRCGAQVPVIGLGRRCGAARAGRHSCIVVAEAAVAGERIDVGLVVDAVGEVLAIGRERIDEGFCAILDIDTLLSPADLSVLHRAAA